MADDLMPQGALSAVAASQDDPTSELPASLIDQDKYARNAYFAGLIAPTKSGHFSESLSNAMDSENKIAMQAAQLRAQYLPLVAQAKMQRDLQRAQIQNYQSEAHCVSWSTRAICACKRWRRICSLVVRVVGGLQKALPFRLGLRLSPARSLTAAA
jgi:hypothetical protein